MRTLAICYIFFFHFSAPVIADIISPSEARHHVGTIATVVGEVVQVSRSSGGTTFVNFGARYPNHSFYGVIFRTKANLFPDIFSLQSQRVAITGLIEMYKGKPQIILKSNSQIELQ